MAVTDNLSASSKATPHQAIRPLGASFFPPPSHFLHIFMHGVTSTLNRDIYYKKNGTLRTNENMGLDENRIPHTKKNSQN